MPQEEHEDEKPSASAKMLTNDNNNNNDNNNEEDLKHPSDVIGGWGPMQQRIYIILTIMYLVAPLNNLSIVFTAPKVSQTDFYCVDKDTSSGYPVRIKNSCTIGSYANATDCTRFEHDKSFHKRTLVNEFDLVCSKSWYPSLSQSMHQVGYAVSGVGLGIISDRYGRFFCAKLAISLEILAGFSQAFAPNIYLYFVARFFVGVAAYGRFLNGLVYYMYFVFESVRLTDKRNLFLLLQDMCYWQNGLDLN